MLSLNAHVYEKELLESVVLPYFSDIDHDPDPEVRCQAVDLLLGLCEDCHSNDFFELSVIVEKVGCIFCTSWAFLRAEVTFPWNCYLPCNKVYIQDDDRYQFRLLQKSNFLRFIHFPFRKIAVI